MMRYGLIGEKLGHSFSKIIHERLAGYSYDLIPLPPEELGPFLERREFSGLNVTIPYKQAVLPYLDEISPAAKRIGAVNTIRNDGGVLKGYNTDFDGLCRLIVRSNIPVAGKRAMILGSGGTFRTARAVLEHLGAGEILMVSRSKKQGALTYPEAQRRRDVELILNASPCGMYPNLSDCPLDLSKFENLCGVVDVIYNPLRTRLVLQAQAQGIPAAGGLYMLVAQARAAAELFLGERMEEQRAEEIYQSLLSERTNLVLIGMPSAGKTSVGKALAEKMGREFVDLDDAVVARTHRSIPELFSQLGEEGFREEEARTVAEYAGRTGLIIATGGGAVKREENIRLLRQNGVLVFLDRSLELLDPGEGRPLSQDMQQMRCLYAERDPLYRQSCDIHVKNDTDPASAVATVEEGFYEYLGVKWTKPEHAGHPGT